MTIIKMNTNNKYDKDFEKGEPLYTVSRNLNWCHPCEKQYGVSQKSKNKTTRKWSESHSVMSDSLQPYGPYIPWNSPGQNTEWVAFPFSRDLPNPGIKPRSPTSQADSLPIEPPGKAKNTAVGSLSFLQQIFLIQKLNWISCTASRFLTISATIWPSNCTSGYKSEKQKQKQKTNLNWYTHLNVHSNNIYSYQDMEVTLLSINRWLKNVWYILLMEYYSAMKSKKCCHLLQHGGTWRELC